MLHIIRPLVVNASKDHRVLIPRGTASSSSASIGSYERTEPREGWPRVRRWRRRGWQTRNWKAKPSSGLSSSTVNKFSSRISRAISGAAVGCSERTRSKYTVARRTSRRKWLFTALEHTLARSSRHNGEWTGGSACKLRILCPFTMCFPALYTCRINSIPLYDSSN